MGLACGFAARESDRDGEDREAPPPNGGLHSQGNGATQRGVLDLARFSVALRDRVGKCGADPDHGTRKLDVEAEEDSHSRRGAFKDSALNALLPAAEGCGPLSGGVRRIPARKKTGLKRQARTQVSNHEGKNEA